MKIIIKIIGWIIVLASVSAIVHHIRSGEYIISVLNLLGCIFALQIFSLDKDIDNFTKWLSK